MFPRINALHEVHVPAHTSPLVVACVMEKMQQVAINDFDCVRHPFTCVKSLEDP